MPKQVDRQSSQQFFNRLTAAIINHQHAIMMAQNPFYYLPQGRSVIVNRHHDQYFIRITL
jgi:hypothetical protein